MDLIAAAACLQWIIAPWLAESYPPRLSLFRMMLPPPDYLQYALPATVEFWIGLHLPASRRLSRSWTMPEIEPLTLDHASLTKAGSQLGSGGMIVVAEGTCMVRLLQVLVRFYHHESCGQCTPCREGMGWLHKIVDRIVAGKGQLDDIERLIAISEANDGTTICGMGDAAGYATVGILAKYRDEFEHWIVHGRSRCDGRLEAIGAEWAIPEAALHG
jgi:hypothetical protein